ncbi:hypothetical protein B0J17DRAFT_631970 [Rhizoctonia solani]|nr:hypothetical protein B0J17DRAFT_631970 [Rhizoctonia solani]
MYHLRFRQFNEKTESNRLNKCSGSRIIGQFDLYPPPIRKNQPDNDGPVSNGELYVSSIWVNTLVNGTVMREDECVIDEVNDLLAETEPTNSLDSSDERFWGLDSHTKLYAHLLADHSELLRSTKQDFAINGLFRLFGEKHILGELSTVKSHYNTTLQSYKTSS